MASKLKTIAIRNNQLDPAALLPYWDVLQSLSVGLNSNIVPYLNTGAKLPDNMVPGAGSLPWPVMWVADPNNANKKMAVVTPDWSQNIGDIADVVRLMGWALQTKRAAIVPLQFQKLGANPPPAPGPRPVLRQGDALLEHIDEVIDFWPRDPNDVKACWDIVLTTQVMLNAMLAGNPGGGGGGKNGLPPDG